MAYEFDIISIGMGPAGMAISAMGAEMGLKVCSIEKRAIGGECMNVGCIPSKALLRMAMIRNNAMHNQAVALGPSTQGEPTGTFRKIADHIKFINDHKTSKMFEKVHLILGQGDAELLDRHTVKVGEKTYTTRKIFINAGTKPAAPPVPGLDKIEYLTNDNIFKLETIPQSMTILGGGAIGCEMAQAFKRLGCQTTIVHMDQHLIPVGDPEAGQILEDEFKTEGIDVYNGRKIQSVEKTEAGIQLTTDQGETIIAETLLVAAGRRPATQGLGLEKAGVQLNDRGYIKVNDYLQTTAKNIYACGDCNGHFLLSHAAMHQGMIGLMNAIAPWPMKKNFKKFVVPWTVFTEPQVSWVGMREKDLKAAGIDYQVIRAEYGDYGAAIAEAIPVGHVKVLTNAKGKIFGAGVVGEGSGEMINQWAQAIQYKLSMEDIMMLQHSFPSMSFLNKRTGEMWMMKKMKTMGFMKSMMKMMFNMT